MLVIDGYNFLYQIPSLKKKGKERGREILLRKLEEKKKSLGEVWVIFDGRREDRKDYYRKVKVIYTEEETADDYIKRMVKKKGMKEKITVVTNDREIQEFVRIHGGEILTVETLREKLFPPKKEKKREEEIKPTPSTAKGRRITEELRKVWNL